jgi:hypothetical protein
MKKRTQLRISKDFVKRLEGIGLTREQISELRDMDRDSATRWIKEFQQNLVKIPKNFVPEIGKDISWIDIAEMVFRVLDFDRNDTFIDLNKGAESVRAKSETQPYGYLLVESPTLNQPVRLPIIHNNDFWLASSVFDEPKIMKHINSSVAELLVTYAPKHMNKQGYATSPHHVLHYVITPYQTLERYYSDDSTGNKRMSAPELELLFGKFTYDGEIRAEVNRDPQL